MTDTSDPVPPPNYDDPKEVYAFYGLAMYWAQVLEHSLLNLAVALRLGQVSAITREVFDQTFESLDRKTLGQLLVATRSLMAVPAGADIALAQALATRNHLAHHFFKIHSESLLSEVGRREMIDELRSYIEPFQSADRLAETLYLPLWTRFGATEEYVQKEMESARARALKRDESHR